ELRYECSEQCHIFGDLHGSGNELQGRQPQILNSHDLPIDKSVQGSAKPRFDSGSRRSDRPLNHPVRVLCMKLAVVLLLKGHLDWRLRVWTTTDRDLSILWLIPHTVIEVGL